MKNYSIAIFLRKTVNFGKAATVKECLKLYIIPANSESDAYINARSKAYHKYPGFEIKHFVVKKKPLKHKPF